MKFLRTSLRRRLPFDGMLQSKGFHLASRYHCCTFPEKETISHLFVNGNESKNVWKHFEQLVNIHSSAKLLQLKLVDWRLPKK